MIWWSAAAYFLDSICSSHWITKFFGLTNTAEDVCQPQAAPATHFTKESRGRPCCDRSGAIGACALMSIRRNLSAHK